MSYLVLPASWLQEVPEELLVTREGWRRAGTDDSMRLDETLLETLQTTQAVGSQHAKQVGIRGIPRRAVHTGAFTHLEKNMFNMPLFYSIISVDKSPFDKDKKFTWISCFRNRRAKWEWFPAEVSWLIIPLNKRRQKNETQSKSRSDRWMKVHLIHKLKKKKKLLDLPYPTAESSVKVPPRVFVIVLPFS